MEYLKTKKNTAKNIARAEELLVMKKMMKKISAHAFIIKMKLQKMADVSADSLLNNL